MQGETANDPGPVEEKPGKQQGSAENQIEDCDVIKCDDENQSSSFSQC